MKVSKTIKDTEKKMEVAIDAYIHDLTSIRTGRANPSILDGIMVEYYGVPTPINQVGNISAPEPRLLVISPWDKTVIKDIERAIMASNIGLNPANDGDLIRLPIPQLTNERRQELVKQAKGKSETFKIQMRNIRRQAIDILKKLEKDDAISEDIIKVAEQDIDDLTKKYIDILEDITENKEAAIMEV